MCTPRERRRIFVRRKEERNLIRSRLGPETRPTRPTPSLRVSLADAVTVASAVCGFLAISVAARVWTDAPDHVRLRLSDHEVILAGALIVAGGLLDSVDGAVARWRGGSPLGEHLELMADVVTFGVAPSVLFAVDAAAYGQPWSGVALGVAGGYMIAVLLRLARYAAAPVDGHGRGLVGLPSPPAAMAAVSIVVLHPPAPLALALMVVLSVLMVASFPFPRITAATAPLMGAWWAFGATAAVGLLPGWPVAAFTLTTIGGLLLLVPVRRLRHATGSSIASGGSPVSHVDPAASAAPPTAGGRLAEVHPGLLDPMTPG
jgi:phosphatidylserine synthase